MALKPNFFQAVAALTLAYQAWKYIKRQKTLLEKWDYDILAIRLLGVTKEYLDIQIEMEIHKLNFKVRAYFKALGPSLAMLISKIGKIDEVQVRLRGRMYVETVPGVFAPVPFDITDSALNLYKYFND